MMKAFTVQDEYEGFQVVEFAKHRATAQANGACELYREFSGVKCKRSPHFDKFYDLGYVPPEELLEDDWWLSCHGCRERICKHDASEEYKNRIINGEKIFCSAECQSKQEQQP